MSECERLSMLGECGAAFTMRTHGTEAPEQSLIIVLMGVAGSGKTTIGQLLAAQLQWEFVDGDDYHPSANVEKMRSGIPLTDADRAPWLEALREILLGWVQAKKNGVLACSALRHAYRERLMVSNAVRLIYLKGSVELLRHRLHERTGHYMREEMLASQLKTLEEPEDAIVVDVKCTPNEIVKDIRGRLAKELSSTPAGPRRVESANG